MKFNNGIGYLIYIFLFYPNTETFPINQIIKGQSAVCIHKYRNPSAA